MRAAVLHPIGDDKFEIRDDVTVIGAGARRGPDPGAGGRCVPLGPVRPQRRAAPTRTRRARATRPPVTSSRSATGSTTWPSATGSSPTGCRRAGLLLVPARRAVPVRGARDDGLRPAALPARRHPGVRDGRRAARSPRRSWCPAPGAVKIGDDVPVRGGRAGRLRRDDRRRCGHQHRPGAARVDTVVVIGCGGVGIAAIQGARLAGAAVIVAVDTVRGQARGRPAVRRHPRGRPRTASATCPPR